MEIKLNHGEIMTISKIDKMEIERTDSYRIKQRIRWFKYSRTATRRFTKALAFRDQFVLQIGIKGFYMYAEYHPNFESANTRMNELWKLSSTAEQNLNL